MESNKFFEGIASKLYDPSLLRSMPSSFIKQPPFAAHSSYASNSAAKSLFGGQAAALGGGPGGPGSDSDAEVVREADIMRQTKFFARARLVLVKLRQSMESTVATTLRATADEVEKRQDTRRSQAGQTAELSIQKVGTRLCALYDDCLDDIMDELYNAFQLVASKSALVERIQSDMGVRDAELEALMVKRIAEVEKRAVESQVKTRDAELQLEEALQKSSKLLQVAAINAEQLTSSIERLKVKLLEKDMEVRGMKDMKLVHAEALRRQEAAGRLQNESLVQRIEELKVQEERVQNTLKGRDEEILALKKRVGEQMGMLEGAFARRDLTSKKAEEAEYLMAEVRTFFATEGRMSLRVWMETLNKASPHVLKSQELSESEHGTAKAFLIGAHRNGLSKLLQAMQTVFPPEFPPYQAADEAEEEDAHETLGARIQSVEDFARDVLPMQWVRLMKTPQKESLSLGSLSTLILDLYDKKLLSDQNRRLCGLPDDSFHDVIFKSYIKKAQSAVKAEEQLAGLIHNARSLSNKSDRVNMFCQFLGMRAPAVSADGLQIFLGLYEGFRSPPAGSPPLFRDTHANLMVHPNVWRPLLTNGTALKGWSNDTKATVLRKLEGLKKDPSKSTPSAGMTNFDALMRIVMGEGWALHNETTKERLTKAFAAVDVDKDGLLAVYQLKEILTGLRPSFTFDADQLVDLYQSILVDTASSKEGLGLPPGSLSASAFVKVCLNIQLLKGTTSIPLPPGGALCLRSAVDPLSTSCRAVSGMLRKEGLSSSGGLDIKLKALETSVQAASSSSVVAVWDSLNLLVTSVYEGCNEYSQKREASKKEAGDALEAAARREEELQAEMKKQAHMVANADKVVKAAEEKASKAMEGAKGAQRAAEDRAIRAEALSEAAKDALAAEKKKNQQLAAKQHASGDSPPKTRDKHRKAPRTSDADADGGGDAAELAEENDKMKVELKKALKSANTYEAKYVATRAELNSLKAAGGEAAHRKAGKKPRSSHSSSIPHEDDAQANSEGHLETVYSQQDAHAEAEDGGETGALDFIEADVGVADDEDAAESEPADEARQSLTMLYDDKELKERVSSQQQSWTGEGVSTSSGQALVPSLRNKLKPNVRVSPRPGTAPNSARMSSENSEGSLMSGRGMSRSEWEPGAALHEAVLSGADLVRMQAAVMRGVKKMGGFPRIAANGRLIGLRLPGLDGKGGVSAAYMSEMVGALHRLYVFNAGLLMQQAERAQHLKSIDEGVEARFAALERAGKAVAEGREASKAAERMVARECQRIQAVYQHVDQLHSALSMLLSGEVVATNEDRPPSDPVDGSMSGIFHAPLHNCVPTHASGSTAQPSPAHLHKSVPTQGSGSTPELSPAPLHNSVPTQASHSTPKLSPAPLHNSVPTQASYLLHVAMDTASFLIAALLSPEGFVGPDRTWHEPQEDTAGGGSYLEGGGGRAAMPWGAAGGMGREGAMPWESAGGLGREGAMPWESAGGLGRQGAMPWESAGGMGRGSAGPWESAGGLGRGSEMLWDAPGEPLLLSRQESQQGWQASGSPSLQLRDLGPTPPAPLPSPRSSSPGWLDLAVSHEQAGAINLPNGEDLICLSQSMMQRSEHFPKRYEPASTGMHPRDRRISTNERRPYTARAYVECVMMRSQEQQMQSQLWQEGKPPGSHRNLPQTSQPSRSGRMMDDGREGSSRETPRGPVGGSAPPAPAPVFRPMLQPSVRVDANGRRMYGWYTVSQGTRPVGPRLPPLKHGGPRDTSPQKKALLPKIDAALTTRPVSKDKLRPIGEGLSRPATAEQQPQGLGAAPVEQQLEGGRGGNASYENVYREIGRPNEEGEGVGEGESLSLLLNPEQMQTSEEGVLHYSDKSVLQTSDKGVLQSNDEGVLQTSDKGVLQSSDEGDPR